jgi:hypothetical protein
MSSITLMMSRNRRLTVSTATIPIAVAAQEHIEIRLRPAEELAVLEAHPPFS